MELSPERERQLALIRDACKALFTEFTPAQHEAFIRLVRERIIATPEKTTKAIVREEAKKGNPVACQVTRVFELTPAEREAHRLEHEIKQREMQAEIDELDKIGPLLKEAGAALGTGDQTTVERAMKWHAARGNQYAKAYLQHINSPEYRRLEDEVEAASEWHPAWHYVGKGVWRCEDPEVYETDKLLALYRRHLAGTGERAT